MDDVDFSDIDRHVGVARLKLQKKNDDGETPVGGQIESEYETPISVMADFDHYNKSVNNDDGSQSSNEKHDANVAFSHSENVSGPGANLNADIQVRTDPFTVTTDLKSNTPEICGRDEPLLETNAPVTLSEDIAVSNTPDTLSEHIVESKSSSTFNTDLVDALSTFGDDLAETGPNTFNDDFETKAPNIPSDALVETKGPNTSSDDLAEIKASDTLSDDLVASNTPDKHGVDLFSVGIANTQSEDLFISNVSDIPNVDLFPAKSPDTRDEELFSSIKDKTNESNQAESNKAIPTNPEMSITKEKDSQLATKPNKMNAENATTDWSDPLSGFQADP